MLAAVLAAGAPLAVRAFDQNVNLPVARAPAAAGDVMPGDAFSRGVRAYRSGDKAQAVIALEAAAAKGHAPSQWQLGKMYAEGDGVERNPIRAFEYFRSVANGHAEDSPRSPFARLISDSFVELGRFFREGIPNSPVVRDLSEAFNMFTYAATYFGDAEAQYQLARMYLDGVGAERSPRRAMRWLLLSAKKQHVPAQAELGRLLLNGDEGLKAQAIAGLMWLELARRNADQQRQGWVMQSYNNAIARASEQDRKKALTLADSYLAQGGQSR